MAAPSGTVLKKSLMLGNFVHSDTRDTLSFLLGSAIAINEQGKIVGIEDCSGDVDIAKKQLLQRLGWHENEVEILVCKQGQFFFPGFIDTHVHASQYPIVGIFGDSSLIFWLNNYVFPAEEKMSKPEVARKVYTACVQRTLAHGTTTAAYYATIHVPSTTALADICLTFGQRAFIGQVCMDNAKFCPKDLCDISSDDSRDKTRQVIEHINHIDPNHEIVSPIITPRFAPACTWKALSGLARMAHDQDLMIQTHISENRSEVSLVAEMFPDTGSYAKVYDTYNLLTPRTILAHGVHLNEGEARLIAERKSKVAHCPCSNSALTSGETRVRWLWDRGIDVGLGTDMSGGYSPSILEAARQAILVSRQLAIELPEDDEKERNKVNLSVAQGLYLATKGGAKVVGLEDKVGCFEVGKDWDAQLVGLNVVGGAEETDYQDPGNVDLFDWDMNKWENIIAKWVYNGDDRNTKKVWVKGKLVHSRP